jgi:hypothetical protein
MSLGRTTTLVGLFVVVRGEVALPLRLAHVHGQSHRATEVLLGLNAKLEIGVRE